MTAAERALDELIVVPSNGPCWIDLAALADQEDYLEARSDFPPSSEGAEPEPVDPGPFEAEPDTIPLLPEPELPEWVLADALELQAAGYTLRKIATAVLPVSGLPDLPTCEEVLSARLAGRAAGPVV